MTTANRRTLLKSALAGSASLAFGSPWVCAQENSATALLGQSYVDVHQFGAKGDGKTDDTAAIQAALDAVAQIGSLRQPVAVFMPPGVYCSRRLTMRSNTALIGIPAFDYERPGGSQIKLIDASAPCLLDISGTRGVTIQGLCLIGGDLGSKVHGIMRDDPDPSTHPDAKENAHRIDTCQIMHFTGDGVRMIHCWCWNIRHSMVAYNGGDGIYFNGWDCWVLDCWLSDNKGAGFGAHGPWNSAVTMTGNRIEWNNQHGVLIENSGSMFQVTGNYFDYSYLAGIAVLSPKNNDPCGHITITGNFFYRSGSAAAKNSPDCSHIRLEGACGVTCVGNSFKAGDQSGNLTGPCSPSYGIYHRNLENCVITNNVLHKGAMTELINGTGGAGVVVDNNPGSLLTVP